MSDDLVDFLAHYGVKGMRWGIRKETVRSKIQDRKVRKATEKRFREYSFKTVQDRRAGKRLTALDYANLSTVTEIVNRGDELRRITRNSSSELPARAYVSTIMDDSIKYRAILPMRGDPTKRQRKNYGEQYEIVMEASKKLKSPSAKERVDAFIELLDEPRIQTKDGSSITGREYLEKAGYGKDLKKLSSQEAGLRFYSDFNAKAGDANSPINSAYFNKIAEKGYNFVVDDNDLGFISKKPMILLDAKGTVKVKDISPLTAEQINKAQIEVFGPKPIEDTG